MRVKLLKDLTLSLSKGVEVELTDVQYEQVSDLVKVLETQKEVPKEKEVPKGIKKVTK